MNKIWFNIISSELALKSVYFQIKSWFVKVRIQQLGVRWTDGRESW